MSESRRVVVGSAEDCDLRISDDPYVSAHHALFTEGDAGRFAVEDLGSTNGTMLVGPSGLTVKVRGRQFVPSGWRVRVGRTVLPWRG